MFPHDYEWYIRHLTEHADMKPDDVMFVDNVADWCRAHGVPEADEDKPIKIVTGNGAGRHVLIAVMIPDRTIEERINALRIRSQLKSVGFDRGDLLNSGTKKIAYLFFKEVASNKSDLAYDDFAADEWVFEQMDRIGVLRP